MGTYLLQRTGWGVNRLIVTVPGLVVVSEMNRRDHWTTRRERFRDQTERVTVELVQVKTSDTVRLRNATHVLIRFVRNNGRKMDGDNLAGAFKACTDCVCKWLRVDDGDTDRLTLEWVQTPGRGEPGVTIELWWTDPPVVQEQPTLPPLDGRGTLRP